MSNCSISHIYKVKGLPKKFWVSPPWKTTSSPWRFLAKIKETGLSPSLTWFTTLMARASIKSHLPEQSKSFPTMHKAKLKFFCILSIGAFINQPRDNCMKIHHMAFNHTISNGSRKTESIRQRFLMLGITRNRYRFSAWIIARDSGKFFNCRTEFSSVKLKHMIFGILEFHNSMKEVPLDFDIP